MVTIPHLLSSFFIVGDCLACWVYESRGDAVSQRPSVACRVQIKGRMSGLFGCLLNCLFVNLEFPDVTMPVSLASREIAIMVSTQGTVLSSTDASYSAIPWRTIVF